MSKNIALALIVIAIVATAVIWKSSTAQNNSKSINSASHIQSIGNNRENIAGNNQEVKSESTRYIDYSAENLKKAVANNGRAVLFFAALGWCPSCQDADRDFKENFDQVPSDVTILRVDYDNDTETKNKYNVVVQDTFIELNQQGDELARWNSGGLGIKALLENLK